MNRSNKMQHYTNLAKASFSAATGIGGNVGDYVGNESPYSGVMGRQSGASENGVESFDNQKELVIDIENTDEISDLWCPLFSVNEGIIPPFNGTLDKDGVASAAAKGIVVSYQGFTAAEINNMILSGPFVLAGVRYDFGDFTQLKKEWQIRTKVWEDVCSTPVRTGLRKNLNNNLETILDAPGFFQSITAESTLYVHIAKAHGIATPRAVQLAFNVSTRFSQDNIMKGRNVVQKFGKTGALKSSTVFS